jgi:hypothetical protein
MSLADKLVAWTAAQLADLMVFRLVEQMAALKDICWEKMWAAKKAASWAVRSVM